MRICNKCQKEQKEFPKKGGVCKPCIKIQKALIYQENREEIMKKRKIYYRKNKKKIRAWHKIYEQTSEVYKANQKAYRDAHKTETREYNRKYREKHRVRLKRQKKKYYWERGYREKSLAKMKKFRDEHPEIVRARKKKYYQSDHARKILSEKLKKRRKNDIQYRLRVLLRGKFKKAVNRESKVSSVLDLLGCSILELKSYLESKFTEDMTWKNHGKWHIDHIRPCASFDLTKPEQQRECFHFSNLQPLWATDNLSKGARF